MAILLAPMEGVVDPVMRDILTRRGGYDLCVTEFIRVTHQVLPDKVFHRFSPELKNSAQTESGIPVLVQLLGSDLEMLLENARRAISLGAPGIDLNFGCPAKTVNRHEGGAKLLESPEKVFQIVNHLRQNLPKKVTLSAKIRLGYKDKSLFEEILSAIHDSQPSWLTIHARTKQEAYIPPAHWEYIAEARGKLSEIPVIANGDIWTIEDAKKCFDVTRCVDFMLGRGAIADPSLALKIQNSHWYKDATIQSTNPHLKGAYPSLFKTDCPGEIASSWSHHRRLLNLMALHPHYKTRPEIILPKLKQWTRQIKRHEKEAGFLFEEIKRLKRPEELGESWYI